MVTLVSPLENFPTYMRGGEKEGEGGEGEREGGGGGERAERRGRREGEGLRGEVLVTEMV